MTIKGIEGINLRSRNAITMAWVALCALALAACESDCPQGSPEISTFSVDSQTVAAGQTLQVVLTTKNFEMNGHKGDSHDHDHDHGHGEICDNSGHAHIYLDSVGGTMLIMTVDTQFAIKIPDNTSPGPHKLIAELQSTDHKPMNPVVEKTIDITVEP